MDLRIEIFVLIRYNTYIKCLFQDHIHRSFEKCCVVAA